MEARTGLGERALWLIAIPTALAFGPSVMDAVAGYWNGLDLVVVGGTPLLALAAVIGYAVVSPVRVRLWPFLPYAVLAIFFALTLAELATERDSAAIPVFTYLAGFLMPWVALASGVVSFIAVGRRAAGLAR